MVYIEVIDDGRLITLNCHKGSKDGEFFQLVIEPKSLKVIKRPEKPDIDASVAYSHICMIIKEGKPLPKETFAAWG